MPADAGTPADADARGADPVNWGPPFVAVGYRTVRAYSMDGKSWTQAPDPHGPPGGVDGTADRRGQSVAAAQVAAGGKASSSRSAEPPETSA